MNSWLPAKRLTLRLLLLCQLVPSYHGVARSLGEVEFKDQVEEASHAVQVISEELEQQVEEGRLDQANEKLLARFPKAERSGAQSLVLGNILYSMDAKLSYALHKEAAEKLPKEPMVIMEWAMEQHRAGEHAGALAAYDAYSKLKPDYAPGENQGRGRPLATLGEGSGGVVGDF